MELMQAIAAHTKYNRMVSCYVSWPDRSLNVSQVGAPDQCDLGRWIYGEGSRHAGMQQFSALVASHAHYHQAAAEIVSRADLGQADVQELGSASKIANASAEVVRSLMFLHRRLATMQSKRFRTGRAPKRPCGCAEVCSPRADEILDGYS